ncbi:acyltransferase family protein [Promicromonospora citrea]|uniref:Acyltransferase n=1 Tax=Promicromonospora citrea TaxID=43677 RepID=A0A8H9GHM1_9MICO|nr:acyltransferase family protein [Promicromonospora citrea]NNH54452.1 acyltransferase [Promicromonospora citrea]GGM27474.1 acyltransferase [Promicromonospora citrea]
MTAVLTPPQHAPGGPDVVARVPRLGHIPELHGLRGLALALVVAFHLFGDGRVSGGVDVFLVLSGYLATRSLFGRRRSLAEHYGRTFSRLVGPALVVLAATAGLAWWAMPSGTWVQTGREILASALYVVNWEMISGQLAYGAAGPGTSPVQHFWSMSVQGQFFLVWPLVVTLVAVLAHRLWISARDVLLVVVLGTTVASFVFALHLHGVDQQVAYFHSWARFWELGVGALLAVVQPWVHVARPLRPVLAWAGLGLVVSSGFVLDGGALFPGPLALWPVAGALLVLVGSGGPAAWGPRRLLELAPLRLVADISYALYLWHWPLLIAYLNHTGRDRIDPLGAAAVLAVSVALSWLTTKLVADPAQRFQVRFGGVRALVAATAAVAVAASGSVVGLRLLEQRDEALLAAAQQPVDPAAYPGALALSPTFHPTVVADVAVLPAPQVAPRDLPAVEEEGCVQGNSNAPGTDAPLACVLNDPPEADHLVVMVGDSHIVQWAPAMREVGRTEGWRVLLMGRHGCRLAAPTGEPGSLDRCWSWRLNVLDELERLRPDAVVVVGSRTSTTRPGDVVVPREARAWRRLAQAGIRVVTLRDNPRFPFQVPACVEQVASGEATGSGPGAAAPCSRPRAEVYSPVDPVATSDKVPDSVVRIDLTRFLCGDVLCEGVVGNVLIYRDDNHLTATYAETLARPLRRALQVRCPWLFVAPEDSEGVESADVGSPPVRERF